jgi:hypothetical protein
MITFKKYIMLRENTMKTPDELGIMSPVEFADYLDSVLVGIKKGSDRYYEAYDSVSYNADTDLINYNGACYWDARNLISKIQPNALKFKKVTSDNTFELHNEYEYVANVNGVPYGLVRYEDPDYDPYGERGDDDESEDEDGGSKKTKGNLKYVWAYEMVGKEWGMKETPFNIGYGDEDLMKEMQQDLGENGNI